MSGLARALAALVLTTGVAVAAPQPVRADSFGFAITTDGGSRDHRGSRGHDDRRSWHDGRGGHRRGGPPPWARGPGPHRGPYAYVSPYAYAPRCQLEWSWWYHSYVQVCR